VGGELQRVQKKGIVATSFRTGLTQRGGGEKRRGEETLHDAQGGKGPTDVVVGRKVEFRDGKRTGKNDGSFSSQSKDR